MFLALFIGVAGTTLASAQATQPQVPSLGGTTKIGYGRVLAVGDSLTVANTGTSPGGWRRYLENSLQAGGIVFNFVGTRDSASVPENHEGHAGWTSQEIMYGRPGNLTGNLTQWMTKHQPDTVILFTGAHDNDSHPSRYLGMLGMIFRLNPNAKVVVGLVPPVAGSGRPQELLNLKRQGQVAAVETFKKMGYPVEIADTVSGMNAATMISGQSPNDLGQRQISQAMRDALKRVWGF
jgi:hypothetical protein